MEENTDSIINEDIKQMQAITAVICERLKNEDGIKEESKEIIAYRMAEMMTAAKHMYTEALPMITDDESKESAFDMIARFRLHYMNIWDMIQEFEEAFMQSIVADEGAEFANPDDDENCTAYDESADGSLYEEHECCCGEDGDCSCEEDDGCSCGHCGH